MKVLGKKSEAVPNRNSLAGVASNAWTRQLAELALYFMLWTEATNLKHTPELLWLIYHIMLCSTNHAKVCCSVTQTSRYFVANKPILTAADLRIFVMFVALLVLCCLRGGWVIGMQRHIPLLMVTVLCCRPVLY